MRNIRAWSGVVAGFAFSAAAMAGCARGANPGQASPVSIEGNSAALAPNGAAAVDGGEPSLGPELAAVRRATAQFHVADRAAAAGYVLGEPCVESPAGAMGMHAPNPALIQSQALDPERPELLLYLPKPGGGLRLIGVEYLQVVLLRNTVTQQVGPWFGSSPWPSTYVVVNPTPQLFGQTFQGPMPGHNPSMPWHWDLHVWVWANNPSGMFAQWNPSLHCEG